jgi:uncharacterized membrane protein
MPKMNWSKVIGNRISKGIILFIVPLIVLVFILEKAIILVRGLLSPIKDLLPEEPFFGIGMLTLASIIVLTLVCYGFGYIAEKERVKIIFGKIDNGISLIIPGYALMKTQASDVMGANNAEWNPVLLGEDGDWKIGIEVERRVDGLSMVFFPEPPDGKSGEIKLIQHSKLKPLDMPVSKIFGILKKYGKDAQLIHFE